MSTLGKPDRDRPITERRTDHRAQYRSPSAAEPERGGPGLLRLALLCAL